MPTAADHLKPIYEAVRDDGCDFGLIPQCGPIGPLDVTIRHHPHTGKPIVTARGGRGTRLRIHSGPTMQTT